VAVHYGGNDGAARETVRLIEKDGGRAFAIRAELGVAGDVDTLFTALEAGLLARAGRVRLDILVNNAAITADSIETITSQAFDRLIAVNTKAPAPGSEPLSPPLCQRRRQDGNRPISGRPAMVDPCPNGPDRSKPKEIHHGNE
jgi:NAD(P)-dependent dehydrogenase (short-subunit alcohol dehydrogenase family)